MVVWCGTGWALPSAMCPYSLRNRELGDVPQLRLGAWRAANSEECGAHRRSLGRAGVESAPWRQRESPVWRCSQGRRAARIHVSSAVRSRLRQSIEGLAVALLRPPRSCGGRSAACLACSRQLGSLCCQAYAAKVAASALPPRHAQRAQHAPSLGCVRTIGRAARVLLFWCRSFFAVSAIARLRRDEDTRFRRSCDATPNSGATSWALNVYQVSPRLDLELHLRKALGGGAWRA